MTFSIDAPDDASNDIATSLKSGQAASGRDRAPFHRRLRAETAASHDAVDAAFSRFALDDRGSYAKFLSAHARILGPLERWLDGAALLPAWQPRAALLAADLADLEQAMPPVVPIDWDRADASRWGVLYVLEGSRLGSAVLNRAVAADLPRAYLSAIQPHGAWRALLDRIDQSANQQGAGWELAAIAAARCVFSQFAEAASIEWTEKQGA